MRKKTIAVQETRTDDIEIAVVDENFFEPIPITSDHDYFLKERTAICGSIYAHLANETGQNTAKVLFTGENELAIGEIFEPALSNWLTKASDLTTPYSYAIISVFLRDFQEEFRLQKLQPFFKTWLNNCFEPSIKSALKSLDTKKSNDAISALEFFIGSDLERRRTPIIDFLLQKDETNADLNKLFNYNAIHRTVMLYESVMEHFEESPIKALAILVLWQRMNTRELKTLTSKKLENDDDSRKRMLGIIINEQVAINILMSKLLTKKLNADLG